MARCSLSEDKFLSLLVSKIKLLEYQGCTCGIDKQDIYEELWQVLNDNYDKLKRARELKRTFLYCLSQAATLIKKQQYNELLPWLKRMYHEMNDLEDRAKQDMLDGTICDVCVCSQTSQLLWRKKPTTVGTKRYCQLE